LRTDGKREREQEILSWLKNFGEEKPQTIAIFDYEPELLTELRNHVFAVDAAMAIVCDTVSSLRTWLKKKCWRMPNDKYYLLEVQAPVLYIFDKG
jgi:hypothetical protein